MRVQNVVCCHLLFVVIYCLLVRVDLIRIKGMDDGQKSSIRQKRSGNRSGAMNLSVDRSSLHLSMINECRKKMK